MKKVVLNRWLLGFATLFIFIIYMLHMQLGVNGLTDPYTTDVGEIQNALPRWGTLHFTGYPQYSFIGSLFVMLAGWVGIAPAAASSLYSAVWGAVAVALLVWVMLALDVPTHFAVVPALLFGLSTSMWIDSTIAELHTMTIALTFATLLVAIRVGRQGNVSDLYWLAFLSSQGIIHQRSFAFMGLGILLLVLPRWRMLLNGRRLLIILLLVLLGPLTYLYLPVRAWMGAEWTFSSPGTWEGFWTIVLDTKTDRIVSWPEGLAVWWERLGGVVGILNDDWPFLLWLLGLAGLFLPLCSWRERVALTLTWAPYLFLSLIIWIGRPGDALLAVKMPIIGLSAIGLAFWVTWLWQKRQAAGVAAAVTLVLVGGFLFVRHRPAVVRITQDESARQWIELVDGIDEPENGRSQTLMVLWGDDYWPLTYAQTYEGYFPKLNIIEHDRNYQRVIDRGDELLTISDTFYLRSKGWWEERLGSVYLTSVAPEIVSIQTEPTILPAVLPETGQDLGVGIGVRMAEVEWVDDNTLRLAVDWQALGNQLEDYSIAVHLVAADPPQSGGDIVAQADRNHPVAGWYPSSLWQQGEVVRDYFLLELPEGQEAVAVRVGLYQLQGDGTFANSDWFSIPVVE